MDVFEAQPPGLNTVAAMRAALAQVLASLTPDELQRFRESTALTLTIPEVRARALDELIRAIGVMAEAVARRAGLPPDDFAARNLAGAITGVILTATLPGGSDPVDVFAAIDAALAHLEAGLPL
jgi:hypothetical protein